jgi:hypothetical protein
METLVLEASAWVLELSNISQAKFMASSETSNAASMPVIGNVEVRPILGGYPAREGNLRISGEASSSLQK